MLQAYNSWLVSRDSETRCRYTSPHLIADKTLGWSGGGGDRCVWACRPFTVARQLDAGMHATAYFRGNKDSCNVLTDMLFSICGVAVW